MKRIFNVVAAVAFVALISAPVCVCAEGEKPTYEELEKRIQELEGKVSNEGGSTSEGGPTASGDVAFLNKYVWRGWQYSDESLVIQPSLTVEYNGFSVNLWGNLDTDVDDSNETDSENSEFNETDFTLAYDTSIGNFDVGVGYIYYGIKDNNGNDGEEFYISVSPAKCPLSTTLTIYREIAAAQGWYVNLSFSRSIELGNDLSLDLGASAGYYYSEDADFVDANNSRTTNTKRYRHLHDGMISAALPIAINEYFTISPMIAYTFPLSKSARDQIAFSNNDLGWGKNACNLFGGVNVSIAF